MKNVSAWLVAGVMTVATCSDAAAFGRGEVSYHARGYEGGHAAVVGGPYGGVHAGYVPPRTVYPTRSGAVEGYHLPSAYPAYSRPGAVGGTHVIAPGRVPVAPLAPGVGAAGHYTRYIGPAALNSLGAGVRGYGYGYFAPNWYRSHLGLWLPRVWWGGLGAWYVPTWDTLAPFLSVAGPPIGYDYGSTAVIQDGTMYLNGESAGTAAAYATDAQAVADAGRAVTPPDSDEWQPLGVFGLIQGNEAMAQRVFQLAVDKSGIVRGNYYDAVADTNQPVYGAVDGKTQRVAWTIGDRKDIVYEAGLSNLTQPETTVLIHYGKEKTNQMVLVRLEQPPPG